MVVTEAPAAVPSNALMFYRSIYPDAYLGQAYIYYITSDGHVHAIWGGGFDYNQTPIQIVDTWSTVDVTTLVGAPVAANGSALASYPFNNNTYVQYLTNNGHVGTLWYGSGSWHYSDLTSITGAPLPVFGSALTSYAFSSNNYVDYLTSNGHVGTIWYGGGSWHYADLTSAASAPSAALGSALTSFISGSNQYVTYSTSDGHIHVLWYGSGSWHHTDLSSLTGATAAAVGSQIVSSINTDISYYEIDILYFSADGHVHDIFWNSSGWKHSDLTSLASGQAAVGGSDLSRCCYFQNYSYNQ